MPAKMIPCPQCGAANSERKEKCFECQQPLGTVKRTPRTQTDARKTKGKLRLPDDILSIPAVIAKRRPLAGPGLIGVTLRQRVQMFRQLEHLIKAGIPLGLSLNYLQDNVAKYLRPMVKDMAEFVQAGGLLSQAMGRYQSIFADWEINLIRAAEKGGNLPEAMASIAQTLEMEMEMRTQVGVKLLPVKATCWVFALVVMIVLAVSNVAGLDGTMTALAQVIMRFFAIVVGFILLKNAWRYYSRSRRGARVAQQVVARMPLIGSIMHLQMQYRFMQVLGALWKAGVSPMDALESAARASGNRLLMYRVADQLQRLGEGAMLAEILETTRIFSPEILYLIRTGETSGAVGESLERVAEYIRVELDAQVKTLPMRAQLVMYAIIAPAVALFVIWFYSRYFALMGL